MEAFHSHIAENPTTKQWFWSSTAEDAFYQGHKYQAIFFGTCTRIYFCMVNVVITAWVVNYSAPILILKLNIHAYEQTKIFWQPKLTQL